MKHVKLLAMPLLALCLLVSVVMAAAPPSNPPSPAPSTSLPDLRGTWTGSGRKADDTGSWDFTLTLKVTEKGSNGLYRGWKTSTNTGGTPKTTIFTARLDNSNTVHINHAYDVWGLRLDYYPTTNTAAFPTGWQPVLIGTIQRVDEGTASPDYSGTGFCFLKKTTP